MNKESFIFYKSFFESIEEIENPETKSKAYKTIAQYALFGQEPTKESEEIIRVIFKQIKPLIDISNNRYNACVENGKKGGRPKKIKNQTKTKEKPNDNQSITKAKPKENQTLNQSETRPKPNPNLNDNVNDNDNINKNVNVNKERDIERKNKEESFFNSLSHKYPKIEINTKTINPDYDLDKILNAIKQSKYLQNAPLSFIIKNYEKVITNCYKSFDYDKNKPFISRDYDAEDDIFKFPDISNIDL